MRNFIDAVKALFEGEVVSLGAHKQNKVKKAVDGLVGGFQAYLDSIEEFKQQFGRFEPLLRDYQAEPGPQNVPKFSIKVTFDRVASKQQKARLQAAGFTVMNDDRDWGTPIHDDETTRSWSHGSYSKERSRNWYPQTEATKDLTVAEATQLWKTRFQPATQAQFGLYRGEDVHYHKGNLQGEPTKGWDIRTHPDHAKHYAKGMSFCITMSAPEHSRDTTILDDDYMKDALRVHQIIQRGEMIRNSGATNVHDLTRR